jgi:hypothetical protein
MNSSDNNYFENVPSKLSSSPSRLTTVTPYLVYIFNFSDTFSKPFVLNRIMLLPKNHYYKILHAKSAITIRLIINPEKRS